MDGVHKPFTKDCIIFQDQSKRCIGIQKSLYRLHMRQKTAQLSGQGRLTVLSLIGLLINTSHLLWTGLLAIDCWNARERQTNLTQLTGNRIQSVFGPIQIDHIGL